MDSEVLRPKAGELHGLLTFFLSLRNTARKTVLPQINTRFVELEHLLKQPTCYPQIQRLYRDM